MSDKDLTFKLFGQDVSASKAMKGVGDSADAAARKVEAAAKKETAAREWAAKEAARAAKKAADDAAREAAREAAARAAVMEEAGGRINTAITRTAQAMGVLGGASLAIGIKTAAGMEQAQIGFATLLGSAEKAQSYLADLKNFAATTPFDFPGLVDASRLLLGVGVDAKQVIPIMTNLGDAAGALAIDQASFQRIMVAVSQSIAAGTIKLGDMNQLMNNGLPVWKLMSEAMGKPVPVLQEMISKGQLLSADVLPKMFAEMNKDYGGAMAAQAKTLSGLWSTLQDTFSQGMAEALQPVLPMLRDGMAGAIDGVAGATAWLQQTLIENEGTIRSWGAAIGDAARWVGEHHQLLLQLAEGITTAVLAYKAITAAQWALNVAMAANPAGLVTAGMAALAGLFVVLWQRSQTFRVMVAVAFAQAAEGARGMVQVVSFAVQGVLRGLANMVGLFDKSMASSLLGAADRVAATARNMDANIQSIRDRVVRISVVTQYIEVKGIVNGKVGTVQRTPGSANDREGRGASASDLAAVESRKTTTRSGGGPISLPKIGGGSSGGGGGGKSKKDTAASKRAQARKDVAQDLKELLGDLKKSRAEAGKALADLAAHVSAAGSKAARAVVNKHAKVLLTAAQNYEATGKALKTAQDKLKKLRDDSASYAIEVQKSVISSAQIASAESVGGVVLKLRTAVAYAAQFAAAVTKLRSLGADATTIDQLVQAGPEQGLKLAEQMIATGKGGVAQIASLQGQLASAGAKVGNAGADALYAAGIRAADGLVAGLKAREKRLAAQMQRLAATMAAAIKKALKIKSPSQVFAEVGDYSGQGLVVGLQRQYGAVRSAAADMVGQVGAQRARTSALAAAAPSSGGGVVIHLHGAVVGDEAHLARTVTSALARVRAQGAAA